MPNMIDVWRVFAEHDRRLAAPPHLEARVLSAVAAAPRPGGRRRIAMVATMAAAILIAAAVTQSRRSPARMPAALGGRPFTATALRAAIEPQRTTRAASLPREIPIPVDALAQYEEAPVILIMFDFTPVLKTEPLQLVRMRVPREALQEFGVALLEPDAAGMIDLDMLVGEDGLPKDIRTVRQQEE